MTPTRSQSEPRALLQAVFGVLILSAFLPAFAVAQTLPAGWAVSDVGSPVIPGVATYTGDTFTVSGAGTGIDAAADQFTFAYRLITGDVTIIARVSGLPLTMPSAQAAVMIRQGLAAGSKHAAVTASGSGGIAFQRRKSTGGATTTEAVAGGAPVWLRLDRRASTITASWSSNGTTWTTIGTDTVGMNNVLYVGLAVSSRLVVAPAPISFSSVQTPSLVEYGGPLPAGWSSQDIGGPGQPGGAAYDSGTFGLRGGGADIGGTWDQFRFAYTASNSDVDIVARVRDLGNTSAQSKAGVMIRDSLTANGAHASMVVTSSGATLFRRRGAGGGASTDTAGPPTQAPVWLKLSLRNGVVTASQSVDGVAWTVVGTQALTLPVPFQVGLAVTSANDSGTVTTNVDSVSVTAVAPPNTPPTAALTAPANGATFTAPANITVSATASDTDGTVARVDFFQGTTLIGSDTTSPYSIAWNNVPAGTYSLTARATDDDGDMTTSAARTVTVNAPANQPPSASLTAPANGATFTAPANITVSANASDSDGTVARVDFFQGTTLIGSDTTSPYSIAWNNVPAGTYSLTARATDDDGATTTSAARTVTVNPPPANQPPTVSLTAPANGATFTAPADIAINANASDTDGTVTRVEFYQGSTLLGSDTTSPYSFTWNDAPAGTYSLTARAIDNAGATTTSAARTVTVTSGLPAGWTAGDVGSPSQAGRTTFANGTFSLTGGGADIWGTSDQFHFASQSASGDLDIVAHIATLGQTDAWSKIGVMVRASLAADAPHASMFVSSGNGMAFQRRLTAGGDSTHTPGSGSQVPMWLKLEKRGATITAYESTNGTAWTTVGAATLTLPATFYVGLAVTSHSTSTTVDATADNVVVQAPAANQPPAAALTAPSNGATFTAPANITVSANASDSDGTIARVDFFQGTTLIGTDTTSPYSIAWSNVPAGTYSITARATDDDGATTTSAAHTITVNSAPANQPPSVSLTAPANGATFTAPANITVSANASDTDGTVARVDFFQGTTLIGSDTTSPYSIAWNNVPAGTYSLTARATDDDGATTTSAARTITVNPPANQPPSVSLTAPANGATFTAPASITVSANASDSDGTVARVDFYQGTTLIGSDSTSPYSIQWNNVPSGTYSLTARAIDDDGATTTSAARTIVVNPPPASQRNAVFNPSPDHNTLVNSYLLEIFAAGADPSTATPLATQNLGKPTPVNGEITADVTATINGLSPGNYQATVSAVGSGGSSRSGPATFTR
jgi:regulation of enolase protein 1 (concanavalin A-like superfamily)/phosphatidylethanolamine-binding protein (PEBP) family uncharacterized protein